MNRSQIHVVSATLGFSFILIFSTVLKDTGMSSLEQLLFRLSFALIMLLPISLNRTKLNIIKRKDVPFFAVTGLIYSLFLFSGLSSIALGTPITVAVALAHTRPFFTAVISQLTGKEKATVAKLGIISLGVLGAFLVSGLQITNLQIGPGPILAVLAGFFWAVYLWLKRQATEIAEYTPYLILFNTLLFAVPFAVVIGAILRSMSANPLLVGIVTPNLWQLFILLLFAAFGTLLPYLLLNYVKVEEVSPTTEGLLLLGDPVLSTIWAIVLFKQYVTPMQYVGVALILTSAVINLKLETKNVHQK